MTFENDRTSGSSGVALGFLAALERWVETDTSRTAAALRVTLLEWLRGAQAAQPTMALIHQFAARALEVADSAAAREDSAADARKAILLSCIAERADLATQQHGVAQTAAGLVTERDSWIATLSASAAVREAFEIALKLGRAPRALVAESRPLFEGRHLAAALTTAGIPGWLVVDAALPMLLSGAQIAWIGADAVTDRGVINKIGSFALALAAREHSVPVYVLAMRRKFLPASTAALKILEISPDEVWGDAPAGVRPRNVCYELVPFELIRGIVVEDSVLGTSEARTVALDRALPDELARG
jgi:translation initiation factor 2B subunit (eIF-2B alpha/beta/delta family)